MTVLVYVNTSKQVGDPEHVKVFTVDAAAKWFEENEAANEAALAGLYRVRGVLDFIRQLVKCGQAGRTFRAWP
jgi:hypothetical protein